MATTSSISIDLLLREACEDYLSLILKSPSESTFIVLSTFISGIGSSYTVAKAKGDCSFDSPIYSPDFLFLKLELTRRLCESLECTVFVIDYLSLSPTFLLVGIVCLTPMICHSEAPEIEDFLARFSSPLSTILPKASTLLPYIEGFIVERS